MAKAGRSRFSRNHASPYAIDGTYALNTDKKVDMSLAAEDERFKPKVRTY